MTVPLIASNELVAAAWIASIPGIVIDGVAPELPDDESTWATNGFITVKVVGGSPNIYFNVRKPVIQVDCWADIMGSNKLPWNAATAIAEQVRTGCLDDEQLERSLHVVQNGIDYGICWVQAANVISEPRRVYSDQGDYAGSSFDVQFVWTRSS
jgi:hypothetical protein